MRNFPNARCQDVGRCELVHGLREGDEDQRDLDLVICEVSYDKLSERQLRLT